MRFADQYRIQNFLRAAAGSSKRVSVNPHYRHFWTRQILLVWQGDTSTAARPCNPRAAEAVETPAATLSRVLDPITRSSPTTKSTARQRRNRKRQNHYRTESLRTAPPSLSLCMILSRHDSVWLAQEL